MSSLTVGSQYRFQLSVKKDGVFWDLTGGTVNLQFRRPDGTTFSRSATVSAPTSGQAYYQCTTSDLNLAGQWSRSWQITVGGITDNSLPIPFTVVDVP